MVCSRLLKRSALCHPMSRMIKKVHFFPRTPRLSAIGQFVISTLGCGGRICSIDFVIWPSLRARVRHGVKSISSTLSFATSFRDSTQLHARTQFQSCWEFDLMNSNSRLSQNSRVYSEPFYPRSADLALNQKLYRKYYATLSFVVTLLLLTISPAYAAPSLSLDSTASYNLTGKIRATQSCTADPIRYANQACTAMVPPPNPPILGQPFLNDDFVYANITQMMNAGWGMDPNLPISYFSFGNNTVTFKNNGTVAPGATWAHIPANLANWSISTRVEWVGGYYGTLQLTIATTGHFYTWEARGTYDDFGLGRYDYGQSCCHVVANATSYTPQLRVWHVLRIDMVKGVISGYFDGKLLLTYVDQDMTPGSTNLNSFGIQGSFLTYDAYDWISAAPAIPAPPTVLPPPPPQTSEVDLSGNVGWSVEGLSSSQVNLQVSHNVGLSVSPFPFFSFTPLTESGSFEQSVNLSTRVESPSTATGLLDSLFLSAIQDLPGSTLAGGVSGFLIQSMLSAQHFGSDYTEWWVNGPLSSSSPVQISHGWSSVTGSESLDLGGSIGTRPAWIVTSQLNQTANVTIPNVKNLLGPSSTFRAMASLRMLWSFDQSADLLLRTNRTLTLSMHSVTPMTIPAIGGTADVTVTRDILLTINLALVLSSTSLSLPKEATHTSSLMDAFLAMPWIPLGLAGLAAGGSVAIILRFTRRGKATASLGPAPAVAPQP